MSCPRSTTPVIEAMRHIGTMRITASGKVMLSYWAASTRKTNTTASTNAKTAVLLARNCWKASVCPLIAEALGQRLGGKLLHDLDSLTLRITGRRGAIELGGRIEIVARHPMRPAMSRTVVNEPSGTVSPFELRTLI